MSRIVTFPYYLHDNYMRSEFLEYLQDQVGLDVTEEEVEKMGRPFYELSFSCAADLDTGKVVLLACEGEELENPVVLNKGTE